MSSSSPELTLKANDVTEANLILDSGAINRSAGTSYKQSGTTRWFTGVPYVESGGNTSYTIGSSNTPENSKLLITSAGNVGIGTAAPGYKLDVQSGDVSIQNGGNVTDAGGSIYFSANAGATPMSQIKGLLVDAAGGDQGGIGFYTRPQGSETVLTERMRIAHTGLVGIGTAAPAVNLDVLGGGVVNFATQSLFQIKSASAVNGNSVEMLFTPVISDQTKTAIGGLRNGTETNAHLYFTTAGSEQMRITTGGNVGIGTAAPGATLHVSGNATNRMFQVGSNATPNALIVNNLGNVGIGIESPGAPLMVYNTNPVVNIFDKDGNPSDGSSMGKVAFGTPFGEWASIEAARIGVESDDNSKLVFRTSGANFPGNLTNTERMVIDQNGSVGIGTTNPTGLLQVGPVTGLATSPYTFLNGLRISGGDTVNTIYQSTGNMNIAVAGGSNGAYTGFGDSTRGVTLMVNNLGNVGIGTTSPSEKLEVNGNIKANAFLYTSDQRLKSNISDLINPLDKVLKLKGRTFLWKSDQSPAMGLIAQEVEEVYPELVVTSDDGMKSVQYGNLVAPLIEAIKAQQRRIDELELRIQQLSNQP